MVVSDWPTGRPVAPFLVAVLSDLGLFCIIGSEMCLCCIEREREIVFLHDVTNIVESITYEKNVYIYKSYNTYVYIHDGSSMIQNIGKDFAQSQVYLLEVPVACINENGGTASVGAHLLGLAATLADDFRIWESMCESWDFGLWKGFELDPEDCWLLVKALRPGPNLLGQSAVSCALDFCGGS